MCPSLRISAILISAWRIRIIAFNCSINSFGDIDEIPSSPSITFEFSISPEARSIFSCELKFHQLARVQHVHA